MCNGTILVGGMVDVLVAVVFFASVLGARGDALPTRASRLAGMDARPPQEVRAFLMERSCIEPGMEMLDAFAGCIRSLGDGWI